MVDTDLERISAALKKMGVKDDDLVEKFIIGQGSGGQKINKTSSCVYLKHIPSGVEIKCQQSRSREDNRVVARKILLDKLVEAKRKIKEDALKELAKTRRQNRKRSQNQKTILVESKRHKSTKKQLRKPPQTD
ncbi:MAG: peptide chain release factor-like protein [Chlamydiales bacterium]|nr:peptide chain release factor-like protein [Chlamydiales bacterium]